MLEPVDVLRWEAVKKKVALVNPTFFRHVESLPNANSFRLLRVRYPFGEPIVTNGLFSLSIKGKNEVYGQSPLSGDIETLLDYPWTLSPCGFLMQGAIEAYIELNGIRASRKLFEPGTLFSLTSIQSSNAIETSCAINGLQQMRSGCHSLVLLPKINHQASKKRLYTCFDLHSTYDHTKPDEMNALFYDIVKSNQFYTNWHTEILFLSKDFFSPSCPFLPSVLPSAWEASSYRLHEEEIDLLWSLFTTQYLNASLRSDRFSLAYVRHILSVLLKETPAYSPAIDDQAFPLQGLTETFIKNYRIRFNFPSFMQLRHFDGVFPIYLSLHFNHFFLNQLAKNNARQTIKEIEHIREVWQSFRTFILREMPMLHLNDTTLYDAISNNEVEFFHVKAEKSPHISHNIDELMNEDNRFTTIVERYREKQLHLPKHALFFHGCIRVTPLKVKEETHWIRS